MVTTRLITTTAFLILALHINACAQHSHIQDYDEVFVTKTVKPGMTRAELYSHFGEPVTETKASDGSSVLFYFKHTKHDGAQDIFGGFEVYLNNDKVLGWHAIRTNDSKQ